MRYFAALYAVAALLVGISRSAPYDPLPWVMVCGAAVALGLAAATYRPLLMPSAAHAGLTATWAGTLAGRKFYSLGCDFGHVNYTFSTVMLLLVLCAGMAVLTASALRSAQHARAQTSPPQ